MVNPKALYIDQHNISAVQLIVMPKKLNLTLATKFVEKIQIVMHSNLIPYLKLHYKIARFILLMVTLMAEEEPLILFVSSKKTRKGSKHLSKA